jgi:hypothetical protein
LSCRKYLVKARGVELRYYDTKKEARLHMALSTKNPLARVKKTKTELSRLVTEYLERINCSKTEIIHTMELLRRVPRGGEQPQGKYFIKVTGGSATPDFDYLLEIIGAIKTKKGQELQPREVELWLAAWLNDYLHKYPKPPKLRGGNSKKDAAKRKAISSFVGRAITSAERWQRSLDAARRIDRARPPTLEKKEYILNNCVVVVGASVRMPPASTEQLFRHNAQLSDLMYLPHLNLGPSPMLLTDNMVIALADADRKRLLGEKHLLVIGGPAVNVATRYLNNRSIFPFCFDEQKRKFDDVFDKLKLLPSLRDSQSVELFYEMLRRRSSEVVLESGPFTGRNVEEVWRDVEEFRSHFQLDDDTVYDEVIGWLTSVHSFFDPVAVKVVKHSRQEPNLGVISLGKNHWADEPHYVCVTVAGLNPFGTVGALRALVYSKFMEHPCGGILNAALPQDSSEYFKFTDANFDWVTDRYTVTDLKTRLGRIQKDNRKGRPTYSAFHGEQSYFEEYAEFVQSFDG